MNHRNITKPATDRRILLSTLWIFAMFNYLYADICTLMDAEVLRMISSGKAGSIQITPAFLLGAAVLMETAIAMVFLSRFLRRPANRVANIIAGVIHTLAVSGSMFVDAPAGYALFFAVIEVACTIAIVILALRWKADAEPAAAA